MMIRQKKQKGKETGMVPDLGMTKHWVEQNVAEMKRSCQSRYKDKTRTDR